MVLIGGIPMHQTIGKRIAKFRKLEGFTQQTLAERLAISRVAVSHIEMDLTLPGERTITLLAGLFKINPHELVTNTTYPQAKSDRLPLVACCHTDLELDLALMRNDFEWLDQLDKSVKNVQLINDVLRKWTDRLVMWESKSVDLMENALISDARDQLQEKKIRFISYSSSESK
jgi:transcriptional regulator with XRE-family HTH domain